MASVSLGIFNRQIPVWGYQINLGQALISALTIGLSTIFLKSIWQTSSDQREETNLSESDFWAKVESTPTYAVENEPVTIGSTTFSNLAEARRKITLSCTKTSEFVQTYLVQSNFQGTVLDLGCGIGANALPLVAKGCQVVAIDKQAEAVIIYKMYEAALLANISNGNELHEAEARVEDITTASYPENVDAVICVDTLPYLHPTQLKETMQKIFQALRPEGRFIGTLFFKPDENENIFTIAMGKLGGHSYAGKTLALEIITRSGFNIIEVEEQNDGVTQCVEFLAEKPATG